MKSQEALSIFLDQMMKRMMNWISLRLLAEKVTQ